MDENDGNDKKDNNKIKKRIKIFDTTLRDGEQSPGATMSMSEKISVAQQLERLGVDIIEAGFAASSQKDSDAIKQISAVIQNAQVCSLSRCTKSDIDAAWGAIKEAKHPRIHVFIATSDIHLEHKLKISKAEALSRIRECVSYAKTLCENIEFSAEDATRTEPTFLKSALIEAVRAGATTINIPDSVGYAQPTEYGNIINSIATCPEFKGVDISVHCHDDLGLAVANSIAGIENGATQVECTINGIGERAGNAALEEIVMILKTREDYYSSFTNISSKEILLSSKMVADSTRIFVQKNKAIVGENAFAHESGIHQHGMIANRACYEIMDATSVGAETKLVIGIHSGKHAIAEFMKKQGIPITDSLVAIAINVVKNSEKEDNVEREIIKACGNIVSIKGSDF
ncbi:MAG: 2-isopropylmalate synthase [archaeon]|jgi:2-isopropylmalate synthase